MFVAAICLLLALVFTANPLIAAEPDDPSCAVDAAQPFTKAPLVLPALPIPADNPITPEKVSLGRKLFFDRRLSFNGTLSCAMCHIPEQGFTQHQLATSVGIEGRFVKRNSPTLYNVAYRTSLFHDGREFSLENQVWSPLLARNEMGNPSMGIVIERIRHTADYQGLFERAFEREVSAQTVGQALAAYERTLLSGCSPFDLSIYGGAENAMTEKARRGYDLFQIKGCGSCHKAGDSFAHFTDDRFHDTGIGYDRSLPAKDRSQQVRLTADVVIETSIRFEGPDVSDLGRYEATGKPNDRWKYRTPSLRNVAITAPYMHDGSLETLQEVIEFYIRGGVPHQGLDPLIKPMQLNSGEIEQLIAFLQALTGNNIEQLAREARSAPIGDY